MKTNLYDRIQTVRAIKRDFRPDMMIPAGSSGVIVECYSDPERYSVDLDIPDKTLSGGYDMENVSLRPADFIVVRPNTRPE